MEENDILIDNIQSQLYDLYIDIKTFLVSSEKEKQNDTNLKEISSTTEPYTIIKYLKNCINILIEDKKANKINNSQNINQDNNNILKQLESYIKKLENDLKYSIKKQFMFKIQKDSLEMKIRGYMEIEEEYEELKEKVKYEGGKFLNNDRKDNEIIILRRENSNLKKEINKIEEKNKNFDKKIRDNIEIINGLKFKLSQMNKKIEELKDEINNLKNKKNLSEIYERKNILNNINKNIIENNNKTLDKSNLEGINMNNINNLNGIGNNKINNIHLKRDLTNYQLAFNNYNFESTKNNPVKALKTIDTYNKLNISSLNKLYNNKNIVAPLRNNQFKNVKKTKSNSVTKKSEENEKSELMNKFLSGSSNIKFEGTYRIRSLNKINKNFQGLGNKLGVSKNNINIRNIQREERHPYEHSALNILGINKII